MRQSLSTSGPAIALKNADYLLLASGHDGDMYYLDGLGQYARATFAENPDGFKALAYLYRGNHGNFNSVWGDNDKGGSIRCCSTVNRC